MCALFSWLVSVKMGRFRPILRQERLCTGYLIWPGLRLQTVGLVWLLAGIALATWSKEIGKVLSS
jgi:hypothetical protein